MLDHRQDTVFHSYEAISSVENLLGAWREFVRGKRKKSDVQEFQYRLMDNILELHQELVTGSYTHGSYWAFKISDPKPRDIHKATVRDRLVHHTLYRKLYPFFDPLWIADSYSCRDKKGTHRAMDRFRSFFSKVSRNHTRTCWVLKCDIRKFFASIDHRILLEIVARHITDRETVGLIGNIVSSFHSSEEEKGLPLGNLTSQMLVNVYMNEFDQFAKHVLKGKRYIRYADDFVFLSEDRMWLESLIPRIELFLKDRLALSLHPDKVSIKSLSSGVDFLGWVHFPDHRILRTSSKRRLIRNVTTDPHDARLQSYRGMLSHGNAHMLSTEFLDTTPYHDIVTLS